MPKFYDKLSGGHINFIKNQHLFFVATAPISGRINLSPKGIDTLRVTDAHTISWLNLTGSGNETAAHLLENERITLMFCAFESKPNILRVYGSGICIHRQESEWNERIRLFPEMSGARQIIDITIESVQTSCGFGVPYFDYQGDRDQLSKWSDHKGEEGIKNYWTQNNAKSIDGLETGIV